jgi:hypothetical protein
MKHIVFALVALVALSLGARVRAETVVLADGSRVEGQVRELNGRVTIESSTGTLTLPADKVLRVETAPAPAAAAPAPEPAQPPAAAPAQPRAGSATSLEQALGRSIDVNFDSVAPAEAFDYVRQVSGINLVLDNDVRADTRPVNLRLHDVSLVNVLGLLAEMNGYAYETRPGPILFVRTKTAASTYIVRIYPVTDLLVSTEDTGAGLGTQGSFGQGTGNTNAGLSTRGSSAGNVSNRNTNLNPQYGPAGGAPVITSTSPLTDVLTGRAQDLILLIEGACGQGTWAGRTAAGP